MNTKCLLIAAVVGGSVLTAWGPSAAFGQCEITAVSVAGGTDDDRFGYSTGISGDYAVVGAFKVASSTGAAYIYERDGLDWKEIVERLVPEVPLLLASGDEYGRAVAISGRVAVVGARKHKIAGMSGRGAVYVFRRSLLDLVWEYEQELTALDGSVGDAFGSSVAVDGDWIVVGAPDNDSIAGSNSGSAYAFHFDGSTWKQARKFRADDQVAGDKFANAVAISGNWVIVGTKQDDDTCPDGAEAVNSGSVSTFFHDPAAAPDIGWEQRTVLQAQVVDGATVLCDAGFSANFGHAVAISGDRLVVGAVFDAENGSNSGSAYIYRLEEPDWVIEQKLTASDGAAFDNFGRSVAIHRDLVLVGASLGDLNDPAPIENTGSVYLYRRSGAEWIDEEELTASDATPDDRFGWYVSIGGDYAIIGAYKQGETDAENGAAYIRAVGTESDCDENGVHDDCDVLGDSSLDSNDNGVLDSCECTIDDDCVGALACISGTCNPDTSLCDFTVNDEFCAIAGTCFDDGELNPDNDCEVCNSAAGDSDWSNRDQGLSCGDDADSTCDHPDTCDGEGLCRTNPEPAGTGCDDDGNECTDDQCDGDGDCGHPDVPDLTPCTSDGNDCTDNRCQSGQCSVLFLSNGMPCGDPFDSECNPADTCDGAGNCLDNVKADGTSCADDGAFCSGEESCQGGVCESAGDPCTAEGLLCDLLAEARNECSCDPAVEDVCDDDVFCTGEEICDNGMCFSPGDPCDVGQLCDEDRGECVACLTVDDCQDDGNDCTETVCRDGACEHDDLAHNTPCGSDLDDDCTEPDTCAVGVCQANDEPAGTNCGDQSDDEPICNPKDTCDGNGTCLDNIPPNDTPCMDDGVFCTGSESCQAAVCESEGDPCTADGLICDDIAEIRNECSCDPAVEGACDDGNECTIDECVAGACNHEAVPDFPVTACTDDGFFCTGEEICNAGECFSPGDPCETGEVCNEDNDICNCDSDDDCAEDGLACNGEEICSGGVCISAGDPCIANVTTPVCTEPTGSCECGTDVDCDDGKVCNGAETCVNGGCVDGADKCDSDQVCNEQENRCEECETGDDDDCNDGDNCTVDRCPFGMCVHETLPECEDDDEDGVINAEDQCPGTPQDAEDVDAIGCTCADAIDTDHDGVIDCNDECDDTPLRESANSSGCSCSQLTGDSDGDGVANACDDCASTPSGESVGDNGCGQSQIDSDQDGVMNDVDECPGTPTGIEVGDDGCPLPVDNANDNGPGQDIPNDNGNDNDNTGDNDNDNTGDNDNDNGNTGDEPASRPCGFFGMINLAFLCLGMVAMRVTRGRHHCSRR